MMNAHGLNRILLVLAVLATASSADADGVGGCPDCVEGIRCELTSADEPHVALTVSGLFAAGGFVHWAGLSVTDGRESWHLPVEGLAGPVEAGTVRVELDLTVAKPSGVALELLTDTSHWRVECDQDG